LSLYTLSRVMGLSALQATTVAVKQWVLHNYNIYTVGSSFAMVRFTTIHFYDTCRVGPSTPDLWCIPVATQASLVYLVRFYLFSGVHVFLLFLFQCSSFKLIVIFPSMTSIKRQKKKNQNSWRYILSWCLLSHGLGLLQQNEKWFEWYVLFLIICVIFYIPNSVN